MPLPKKPRRRKKGGEPAEPSETETAGEAKEASEASSEAEVEQPAAEAEAKKAEAPAKVKPEAKADAEDEAVTDATADQEADVEAETDAEAGTDAESETEAEAETDAESETDAEATPEPDDAGEKDTKDKKGPKAKGDPQTEADAKARAKEASKPKRRRGAAETGTRKEPARPAPRRESDGAVQIRAQARYVRSAPRKARLVMAHIRGKRVDDARAILRHTPRAAATDIAKLLESAVANAENNFELDPDDLKIDRAFVDEGPTIKRVRPRALGRATPIHKRTSHMTITLTTEKKG